MKKLINIKATSLSRDMTILILRILIGAFMLLHTLPKLIPLLSGHTQFPGVLGIVEWMIIVIVSAELVFAAMILSGFCTRFAAIMMFLTVFCMSEAGLFGNPEVVILYMIAYAVLFTAGAGKYSLDHSLKQNSEKDRVSEGTVDPTLSMYA